MIRIVNLGIAVLLAAVVTTSLFFLMQLLIASGLTQPERGEQRKIADITMPQQEVVIQRQEPKPEKVEEPEEIPDLPDQTIQLTAPTGPGISLARVNIDLGDVGNGATISAADAEYLPIVTIAPQYPQRALARGIEGWCQVMFTVTENGTVVDPVVVDAEPPNIFDSSSIRAVQRFKFNPRTKDGQPVRTPGVQYVFRYNLDQDQ
ncbi:MAG: TonB family protein [Pseudomonadales bacterium]|nr:TonB family protein [Pseudomonadales bacterium]